MTELGRAIARMVDIPLDCLQGRNHALQDADTQPW